MNKNTDYEAFSALWIGAHEVRGRTVSKVGIKLAFSALSDWSLDAISNAITRHIADPDAGRYPVTPADIVRLLQGGGAEDLANLAWSRVERAIRLLSPWDSLRCDDPFIAATLRDMGGWIKLCSIIGERELIFVGKDFKARYAAYLTRGRVDDPVDYFPGIEERDCIAACYEGRLPRPVELPGSTPVEITRRIVAHSEPATSRVELSVVRR